MSSFRLVSSYKPQGDQTQAIDRLVDVAMDESRPPTDRAAALDGLIVAGDVVQPYVPDLLSLLSADKLVVQAAAVRFLGPWPAARTEIQRLAEDESTHFDVRRFARRALESGEPR